MSGRHAATAATQQADERDQPDRLAGAEVDVLEGAIAERRDHEEAESERDPEKEGPDPRVGERFREDPDEPAEGSRRRRDREADEPPLVDDVELDVEAGEPAGPADEEEERREQAEPVVAGEAPVVDEEGGGEPEREDVGERVELLAERGRRAGQPGDAAVE